MNSDQRGAAALVGAVVIWGATFVGSKVVLRHLAPTELAFIRQVFGLPPLLWLAWRTHRLLVPVRYLLPLAATGMVGFFLFANLGLARASASVGGLVQGLAPVLIALLAVTFLRERPTPRVVTGIVLALAGAALLAWGTLRLLAGRGIGRASGAIRVVARCPLEPRRSVFVIETAGRFHQKIRIRLGDGLTIWLLACSELKVSLVPDGQRVDRFLADQIPDCGVHHLPVLQVNVATVVLAGESELARLSGYADQLDDVGQRKLFERSLEGHFDCFRYEGSLVGSVTHGESEVKES